MKSIFQKVLLLTLTAIMMLPLYVSATYGPGFSTDVDDGCEVPLDGGLGFLAAAGIGYAVKKAANHRKKKQQSAA